MNRLRTLIIALAVAVGGGVSPITAAAQAQYHGGLYKWERYYSDATYTTQVGVLYQYCDMWTEGSGQVTEYSLLDYYSCG